MKQKLKLKLINALKQDKGIMTTAELIVHRQGEKEDYLEELGLTKRDLKLLERERVVIRGRLPTTTGHRRRWILIGNVEDYLNG